MEVSLQASWGRKNHVFSQNKKCKNLTKRPEHFFCIKTQFWSFSESVSGSEQQNQAGSKIVPQSEYEMGRTKALTFKLLKVVKKA